MKANEIIIRQDRVIYTLMILLAGLGLLWSFWQRQHPDDASAPATTATQAPAAQTTYVR